MSLQASGLGCDRGERDLFSGIELALSKGEALHVVGANGSGKTTLLRMLCGLMPPSHGQVRWDGKAIRQQREQYQASLLYVGHANAIKDELLAWENLALAASLAGAHLDNRAACEALDRVGLEQVAELPARALSQGQRRRLALARLWLDLRRPLWILDEPFTALDTAAAASLHAVLEGHLTGGGLLVYTTHQEAALKAVRHQRLYLGREVAC